MPCPRLQNKRRNKMPKMKTHKSAAKRYKITASGKIQRRHAGIGFWANSDLKTCMSGKGG